MPIYEEVKNEDGTILFIRRTDEDGKIWSFPTDPANSDYQRYLNPDAKQSTPIVTADE